MKGNAIPKAFIALGIIFMVLGFTQSRNAFIAIGFVFLMFGVGMSVKGRRSP